MHYFFYTFLQKSIASYSRTLFDTVTSKKCTRRIHPLPPCSLLCFFSHIMSTGVIYSRSEQSRSFQTPSSEKITLTKPDYIIKRRIHPPQLACDDRFGGWTPRATPIHIPPRTKIFSSSCVFLQNFR